jgi:hypothetical protein
MATKRRWLPIVVGVLILLAFVAIGVVIAGVAWFQQNVHVAETTEGDALREFDAILAKHPGRAPLLEFADGTPRYTGGVAPAPAAQRVQLQAINVLVWSPREDELTRVSLPFWLVRLKSEPIRLSAYASGLDDEGVSLRPEDIERFGPGIILDMTSPSRERILVWTH